MTKQKTHIKLSDKKVEPFNSDAWLSVNEVSKLLNRTPKAIREACRERQGCYKGGQFSYRMVRGNGGEQYQIALSSLSEDIQAKYSVKNLKSLTLKSTHTPLVYPNAPTQITLHDHDAAWLQYNKQPKNIKDKAEFRQKILMDLLTLTDDKKHTQEWALGFLEREYGQRFDRPKISRWKKLIDGISLEHWLPYLAPNYIGRAKDEIYKPMWDYFLSQYFTQAQPQMSVIYREVKALHLSGHWDNVPLPSCKTFKRRVESDIDKNTFILARRGPTALKNSLPHQWRDYEKLGLHEAWGADGRIFDVLTKWDDDTVCRPHIIFWIDMRARYILSFLVYTKFNTELTIESFTNALKNTQTIPQNIMLDNGREFANKSFTGGQKTRHRFKIKDNEVTGLTTLLGIQVHFAQPGHGAAKLIERMFNTLSNLIDKRFPKAYVGKDTVSRPEDCDPRNAVPIREFTDFINQQINVYHSTLHRGHGMGNKTPRQKYEELAECYIPRPPTIQQINACRPLKKHLKFREQCYFEFKIDGYGVVRYEPSLSLNLTRGKYYDLSPMISNPELPALIYDGVRYLGSADYVARTGFLDSAAAKPTLKKRGDALKKAKTTLNNIYQEAAQLTHADNQLMIIPAYPNIKILPTPKPIKTTMKLENGDVIDAATGELLERSYSDLKMLSDTNEKQSLHESINEELMPDWYQNLKAK